MAAPPALPCVQHACIAAGGTCEAWWQWHPGHTQRYPCAPLLAPAAPLAKCCPGRGPSTLAHHPASAPKSMQELFAVFASEQDARHNARFWWKLCLLMAIFTLLMLAANAGMVRQGAGGGGWVVGACVRACVRACVWWEGWGGACARACVWWWVGGGWMGGAGLPSACSAHPKTGTPTAVALVQGCPWLCRSLHPTHPLFPISSPLFRPLLWYLWPRTLASAPITSWWSRGPTPR